MGNEEGDGGNLAAQSCHGERGLWRVDRVGSGHTAEPAPADEGGVPYQVEVVMQVVASSSCGSLDLVDPQHFKSGHGGRGWN